MAAAWTPAAGGLGHRNWNWNHRGLNGGYAGNYQNYAAPAYAAPVYAAPAYAAPVYAAPAYAAPMYSGYGGGNGCGGARARDANLRARPCYRPSSGRV